MTPQPTPPLTPDSEAAVADLLRGADAPLWVSGGGTRGPSAPAGARVLSTAALCGITLYEPGALTLVAKAGTPMAEVAAALSAERQHLAFEPPDFRALMGRTGTPTVGGLVATGASGPRRVRAGACRDALIGVRFVDGRGTVIKNGGRVMKNVTGYDLSKLMCGAHGTLGVLTEVAFKLLPAPPATATLIFDGLTDAEAGAAMTAALGTPYEVTGAAHLAGETWLRVEGFDGSVSYRAQALAAVLGAWGTPRVESDPGLWRRVRDVTDFADCPGDVWRLSVKPGDGPGQGMRLREALGADVVYDWGGGLIWALVPAGADVRAHLDVPGHATRLRGRGDGARHPEAPAVAALSAGLRRKFDPRGILNPGAMEPA